MTKYIKLLRPSQWSKNVFIFAGLIFSRQFYNIGDVLSTIYAFFIFSLLASSIYILNDIHDYEEDKMHPTKSKRPIATGEITRTRAWFASLSILLLSLLAAWFLNKWFLVVCFVYAGLMIFYSWQIKQIVILDVLFVAFGYVLRAVAGAVVISVEISSWLLLCTLLLALFLVLSKRRTEIVTLGEKALEHRKILSQYPVSLLNQMIAVVTSACIVSYCLYTLAPETVTKFNTRNLIFTVPFVIYGIFRYLFITYRKLEGDIPEKIILTDLPLQICLFLWAVSCIVILVII
ncbi:MAG: decaprenyl-phosphate phosphoribosyltransferase [bacterium]